MKKEIKELKDRNKELYEALSRIKAAIDEAEIENDKQGSSNWIWNWSVKDANGTFPEYIFLDDDKISEQLNAHRIEVRNENYQEFLYHDMNALRLNDGRIQMPAKRWQKLLNGDLHLDTAVHF